MNADEWACFSRSFVDTKNRLISCKDESLVLEFFYPGALGCTRWSLHSECC